MDAIRSVRGAFGGLLRRAGLRQSRPEAFAPGHFHSVLPSSSDLQRARNASWPVRANLPGIDLNVDEQLGLVEDLAALAKADEPFWSNSRRKRFVIQNNSFSYDDAPVLHYMLRKLRPKKVIEIGCGHSSAAMLDTDDLYLGRSIKFDFIDPHPERLERLLLETDADRATVWKKEVQDVDLSLFDQLDEGDLLFVDSSHVVKAGSDLQYIFFEVLPRIRSGVWIHMHDIRFPFEYSQEIFDGKIFWNEAYFLRAFLMFNHEFKIGFWLNFLLNLDTQTEDKLMSILPLQEAVQRFGGDARMSGGSVYLRRV